MLNKKDILAKLKTHRDQILEFGVKKIGIFGSFVRNAQDEESDIDVLVQFRKGEKTFDHYMELKDFLEKLFHRKIDLVIQDVLKPRIKTPILKGTQYA